MNMTLVVNTCADPNSSFATTASAGRLGRLTVTDQTGAVAYTQANVKFTTNYCLATFTMTFSTALLSRFLNPDDPLFLQLEACKTNITSCPFGSNTNLDSHPSVFSGLPIESVLPDIAKQQAAALTAEETARINGDSALTTALNTEKSRAMGAEQSLGSGLSSETSRALGAEQTLSTRVTNEVTRATGAEQTLTTNLSSEVTRASGAEQTLNTNLSGEVTRASGAESALNQSLSAEALRATQAEMALGMSLSTEHDRALFAETTLGSELTAETARATTAEANEVSRATGAEGVEAQARTAGDQAERDYANGTFLKTTGGTVTGDLTVTGVLHLKGGISWDQCPGGLNDLEVTFPAYQGTTNRLCASEVMTTQPSVQLADVIASYIQPICPMVTTLSQNYFRVGGPAAIAGLNLLLGKAGTLITDQLTPLATGLLSTGTGATNDAIEKVNTAITAINTATANSTATINSVIDAYNGAVTGINNSIGSLNTTLTQGISKVEQDVNGVSHGVNVSVQSALNGVVDGINYNLMGPQDCGNTWGFNYVLCHIDQVSDAVNSLPGAVNYALQVSIDDITHNINYYIIGPRDCSGGITYPHTWGLNWIWCFFNIAGWAPEVGFTQVTLVPDIGLGHTPWAPTMPAVTFSQLPENFGSGYTVPTVPGIDGTQLNPVSAPVLQPLHHVDAPSFPAFNGFNLVGAVDFNQASVLIGNAMSPVCDNIQSTAQTYIQVGLGSVPAMVPTFEDADKACGSRGAHVCSTTEIGILAGTGAPSAVGFAFGDWAGPGQVILNQNATSGLLLAVDWPFIHVDASKLLSFPPGWPFTFTPPVVPTGHFRCCASSTAFN
jgi:hypothetical protein